MRATACGPLPLGWRGVIAGDLYQAAVWRGVMLACLQAAAQHGTWKDGRLGRYLEARENAREWLHVARETRIRAARVERAS